MIEGAELKKKFQVAFVMAIALCWALMLLIGAVAFLIARHGPLGGAGLDRSLMEIVGSVICLLTHFLSMYVKRRLLASKERTIEHLHRVMFMSFAICEAGILLSVILAFINYDIRGLIPPLVFGALGFSTHFPKYDQWQQWLRS